MYSKQELDKNFTSERVLMGENKCFEVKPINRYELLCLTRIIHNLVSAVSLCLAIFFISSFYFHRLTLFLNCYKSKCSEFLEKLKTIKLINLFCLLFLYTNIIKQNAHE